MNLAISDEGAIVSDEVIMETSGSNHENSQDLREFLANDGASAWEIQQILEEYVNVKQYDNVKQQK